MSKITKTMALTVSLALMTGCGHEITPKYPQNTTETTITTTDNSPKEPIQTKDDPTNIDAEPPISKETTAAMKRLDKLFAAMKSGDVKKLLNMIDPSSDSYILLQSLNKNNAYCSDLLTSLFGNVSYQTQTTDIPEISSDKTSWLTLDAAVKNSETFGYYIVNSFPKNTPINKKETFANEYDSLTVLQQTISRIPATRSTIHIGMRKHKKNIVFNIDDLFDDYYLSDIPADQNNVITYYLQEIIAAETGDVIAGPSDKEFKAHNKTLNKIIDLVKQKDFEQLTDLFEKYSKNTNTAFEYRSTYGSYDALSDKNKKKVDKWLSDLKLFISDYDEVIVLDKTTRITSILLYENNSYAHKDSLDSPDLRIIQIDADDPEENLYLLVKGYYDLIQYLG